EDWIRVYIEDYVHTYIQRLRGLDESGVSGGMLLGKKQRINGIMHLFIRGAVVADDPFWRDPGQTPGKLKAECSVYFPELEICGFFISSRENRSSEVDLVRIFETHFPSEYQILFNVRDQDEEVFSYSGHGLIRLAGYYIYYEKNEEMQSYIIRQESLRVLERRSGEEEQGNPAVREVKNQAGKKVDRTTKAGKRIPGFAGRDTPGGKEESGGSAGPGMIFGGNRGKKMDKGPDNGQTGPEKEGRMAAGKKPSAEKKVKKGDLIVRIVSIAGIFILAFLLFSDQIKFNKVDETAENSSGLLSSILNESSAIQAGADSAYIETGTGTEIGNGSGENSENGEINGSSAGGESAADSNLTGSSAEAAGSSVNQNGSSDDKQNGNSDEKQNGSSDVKQDGSSGEGENGAVETEDEKSTGAAAQGASTSYVFPMRYLVKKGDSLYSICEKYYGDTGMVDAVCLENDISDPSSLKYGTVLTLPER
ncbi:MAG: LysM peptidoglycan-binding domain-containing protein, partial [Lachnospiraceae bacterium]